MRNKRTIEELLSYMHQIEAGESFTSIYRKTGIHAMVVKAMWLRYQKFGIDGLIKQRKEGVTNEMKAAALHECLEGKLTLTEIAVKYDIDKTTLLSWRRKAAKEIPQLKPKTRIGRRLEMKRKEYYRPERLNISTMTDEQKNYELEWLRAEVDLLKKYQALVKKNRQNKQ